MKPKKPMQPAGPLASEMIEALADVLTENDAHLKDLLRRCGVTADIEDTDIFWTQLQAVGLVELKLSRMEFWEGYLQAEVIAMLEAHVRVIERNQKPTTVPEVAVLSSPETLADLLRRVRAVTHENFEQWCDRHGWSTSNVSEFLTHGEGSRVGHATQLAMAQAIKDDAERLGLTPFG